MNNLSNHHLYPKHLWWTNNPNNIVQLQQHIHQSLHNLLDKNWLAKTPVEQINQLIDILSPAFTLDFKSDIYNILNIPDNKYYYKNWIIRYKKY